MNILITEPLDFNPEQIQVLEKLGTLYQGPFSRKNLLKAIRNIDVLIIRLGHKIDKELLDQACNLQYILTPTTGINHIDSSEAEKRNIQIISLKGETDFLETIPSTAEHSLSLMLSLIRKIPAAHNHVLKGEWNRDKFKSHNLNSYKLGILGYGRVGKQMAGYAEVFKMPWIFYDIDPKLKSHQESEKDLISFLKKVDILSIHIPLNQETKNFINASNLKFLKKGSFIVNTSRGEVIEDEALTALIQNGHIAGFATDVLVSEIDEVKRRKNPLLKLAREFDNIIITPHIAGATYESMWLTEKFIIEKWITTFSCKK
ncbi:NAD(P)-dependent oxidoreductase [Christiangramia aquimixticola]|uniref:NAD(P)-dependent oxidoreductase n=1 Tax=Christiangramia aquimixticola TaxID=1697558 RepID=UPI003AA820D6